MDRVTWLRWTALLLSNMNCTAYGTWHSRMKLRFTPAAMAGKLTTLVSTAWEQALAQPFDAWEFCAVPRRLSCGVVIADEAKQLAWESGGWPLEAPKRDHLRPMMGDSVQDLVQMACDVFCVPGVEITLDAWTLVFVVDAAHE